MTYTAPQNAAGQIIRLEESINSLETMPMRFRGYETEPWRSKGMRVMTVDNYVVLYIPDKEKRIVYIVRVIYRGRDIDAELKTDKRP